MYVLELEKRVGEVEAKVAYFEASSRPHDLELEFKVVLSRVQTEYELWKAQLGANHRAAAIGVDRVAEEVDKLRQGAVTLQSLVRAVDSSAKQLDELEQRVTNCHSALLQKHCRLEATVETQLPVLKADVDEFKNTVNRKTESWMKEASMKLREALERDMGDLKKLDELRNLVDDGCESNAKLDRKASQIVGMLNLKIDTALVRETQLDTDAAIMTVRDMVESLGTRLDTELEDQRRELRKLVVRG